MKFKKSLIPVALLLCICLTGFTRSVVAQDVDVYINMPYSGNYNNWSIDFYNDLTQDHYHFETNDASFPSSYLGTVPAGTYRIEFNSDYFDGFEFGVTGPSYYQYHSGFTSLTFYHAVIETGTTIQIDEGY
jgi:hypothetical protein